jgi:hypothetical protein
MSWYSVLVTLGTSTLWVEGESSSYLREVKICVSSPSVPRTRYDSPAVDGTHVGGDQVNLGVSVLSSLGGRHVNDLARVTLDDNVSSLPTRRNTPRPSALETYEDVK